MKRLFAAAIVLLPLFSCSSHDSRLEFALELAGENRTELEKVLKHYEDDPEKLAAARFLIEKPLLYNLSLICDFEICF